MYKHHRVLLYNVALTILIVICTIPVTSPQPPPIMETSDFENIFAQEHNKQKSHRKLLEDKDWYRKLCQIYTKEKIKSYELTGFHRITRTCVSVMALRCFTKTSRFYLIPHNGTYYQLFPINPETPTERLSSEELKFQLPMIIEKEELSSTDDKLYKPTVKTMILNRLKGKPTK